MHLVINGLAALAVAGIFYAWREYNTRRITKERRLRQRVAYMLWVMANGPEIGPGI